MLIEVLLKQLENKYGFSKEEISDIRKAMIDYAAAVLLDEGEEE